MSVAISGDNGIDKVVDGSIVPADLSTGAPSWTSGGVFSFNSGYGSVATAYGCRAWVNFNGTGTVAIRASGNVSSVTENANGNYTVNFTNNIADTNYIVTGSVGQEENAQIFCNRYYSNNLVGSTRVYSLDNAGTAIDCSLISVAIFR
jgi:hypothetical protein